MSRLIALEVDPRYHALPIDLAKVDEYLLESERLQIAYHMKKGDDDPVTGKAPEGHLADFPPAYRYSDCSNFVRCLIAYATAGLADGSIVIPDGSVNQHDFFVNNNFKPTEYENCALIDEHLRIAFLSPSDTAERVGHVWLARNAKTLECYGGHGPGARTWNTPILMHCHACFVVR
jgi:hypothetical protein